MWQINMAYIYIYTVMAEIIRPIGNLVKIYPNIQ